MTCSQWREIASDHIEGTLNADRRAQADAHLAGCDACRGDAAALRGIARALETLPAEDPPLFFAENVRARIDRERAERGWRALLPRLGRVGIATTLTGAVAAAFLWNAFLPTRDAGRRQQAGVVAGVSRSEGAPSAAAPRLKLTWTQRADADDPAVDVALALENADRGAARCDLAGDPNPYRFTLDADTPQTLRIPFAAARGDRTLALRIRWNADGAAHERRLALPLRADDAAPALRQSFGIRDLPLAEGVRELVRRYGVPVTLDDVPEDLKIAFDARDETAEQVLRRHLTPRGLTVAATPDGLTVAPAP